MFNERDRRCAAVQRMLSTDPSYDNRTIASNVKMQIRTVQRLKAQLNASDDPLKVVDRGGASCHLTSSKSALKSTPKCTWVCWRVWWSPGADPGCGRPWVWQTLGVADPGCGSRTPRRPTNPKRPRLGFRSATTLYSSLTGPPPSTTWTRWTTSSGHTSRTSPTWPPTTPKPAWSPPSILRWELGMLPLPDRYRGGNWGWRRLH